MTHLEFTEYHNFLIEFKYKGQTKAGVILDTIPYSNKKVHTEYLYIRTNDLLAWREAESKKDNVKMKSLSEVIDISKITDARKSDFGKIDIERRVKDWKNRINEFYNVIKQWLSEEAQYKVVKKSDQQIYEWLMKEFDAKSEILPSADIYFNNSLVMSIKPTGLWIIGANGRMDIISQNSSFTLVDLSDHFRVSKWYLYESSDKKQGKEFTKEVFLNLLSK